MSDAYERVKGGRLTFKGGALATRSKPIDKKNKKKKSKQKSIAVNVLTESSTLDAGGGGDEAVEASDAGTGGGGGGDIYTIDAAKKMKYEELFPVEAKKFGYDPKAKVNSVEEALDDRVKKKADRYCK